MRDLYVLSPMHAEVGCKIAMFYITKLIPVNVINRMCEVGRCVVVPLYSVKNVNISHLIGITLKSYFHIMELFSNCFDIEATMTPNQLSHLCRANEMTKIGCTSPSRAKHCNVRGRQQE